MGLAVYSFSVFIILLGWILFRDYVKMLYNNKVITDFKLFLYGCVFWPLTIYEMINYFKKENKNERK
jgi:hypothetical protein